MENKRYCSICGEEMDEFDRYNDYTIHKRLGYGSKHDGEELDLHICSECLDKIIDLCIKSPLNGGTV